MDYEFATMNDLEEFMHVPSMAYNGKCVVDLLNYIFRQQMRGKLLTKFSDFVTPSFAEDVRVHECLIMCCLENKGDTCDVEAMVRFFDGGYRGFTSQRPEARIEERRWVFLSEEALQQTRKYVDQTEAPEKIFSKAGKAIFRHCRVVYVLNDLEHDSVYNLRAMPCLGCPNCTSKKPNKLNCLYDNMNGPWHTVYFDDSKNNKPAKTIMVCF